VKEKRLNRSQLQSVRYGKGPLLIIAGAGTGKTTVITERIGYLIGAGLAKPESILALTFTDKAAMEMEERVDLAMPYGYTDMWIATFHSFCDRVLRQEGLQIGLDSDYKLMSGAETTQFLINHLFQFKLDYFRPRGNPTKFVAGLLQHFSRLRDEDVQPKEYLAYAKKRLEEAKTEEEKGEAVKTVELAEAYQDYQKLKIKEGVLDFADLIVNVLRLFRTRRNVLSQYRKQFKYILVDEFQDTNIAQNELVLLLAGRRANLTVVADDDQSVYKWRGAAISNVIQFKKHFPQAKVVSLTKNYRSTQIILDGAYRLIKHNNPDRLEVKEKIDKRLVAVREEKGWPIEFIHAGRVEEEAELVVRKIVGLTRETKKYDYKDVAVLVRANNHVEPFVRALARAGVPYQFLGPGQLFHQPEVKDLIAYLKVLYNFENNVALYRVLSMKLFDLSDRDLAAIGNYAYKANLSFFEACEEIEKVAVAEDTKKKIDDFVKMVYRHLKLLRDQTAGQILYYFLQDTGFLKILADYQTPGEEKQAQNIAKFFDRLKAYEVNHDDASVRAVVDWLDFSLLLGESPTASDSDWEEENKVNLLTIHSAKGLEFPVVFLVNLVSARFPTRERREIIPIPQDLIKEILPVGNYHEQEERRLFYVGMTRAKDRLFLTAADYYGEGKREKKLSPFVVEALGKDMLTAGRQALEEKQLSIFDFRPVKEKKEKPFAFQPTVVPYLSYSQIDTFNTCPRRYRYRYLQRIPVSPSAALSFGSSVHQALRDFYQVRRQGGRPTEEDLIKFLIKNWSSEGYASKIHEKRMKEQGEQMLRRYYQKGYNPEKSPRALEQSFAIKITPRLKIGGRIDRVDETDKGLEIIDYKTGRVWDQKKVDESLQMTVYALAAVDKGIYNRRPNEVVLSFYFLGTGEKKTTRRTDDQLNQAKKEIIKKAGEIEQSAFEPKPGIWCDFCEYRLLCEAWK